MAASFFCFLLKKSSWERCQEEKDIKKNSPCVLPIPLLRPRSSLQDPPQHHNHPFTPTLQTFTGHPSLLKSPSPSLLKAVNQSLLFTCNAASSIKEGPTWKLRHHPFPFMGVRCIYSFRPRANLFYFVRRLWISYSSPLWGIFWQREETEIAFPFTLLAQLNPFASAENKETSSPPLNHLSFLEK